MSELAQRLAQLSPEKRQLLLAKLQARERAHAPPTALGPRPTPGPTRLTYSQRRLYFLDRLDPGNRVYHIPLVLHLTGALAVPRLNAALSTIVARHAILRTTFQDGPTEPVQVSHPAQPVCLEPVPVDATTLAAATQAVATHTFDLATGPLVHFALLRGGPTEHWLVTVFHHIICDGWSLKLFQDELVAAYTAAALPALPVQYADYAWWEGTQPAYLAPQLQYWQKRLQGAPAALELPTDHPRPRVRQYQGARVKTRFPPPLRHGLEHLAQQQGATLFMVLMAALQVVLARYSGQRDLCVGFPIAGREHPELEALLGVFINTLVLRGDLSGTPSFLEFLAQVRTQTLEAFAHRTVPFEKLIEELNPPRDPSRAPIFQVLLILQNQGAPASVMDTVQLAREGVDLATTMFDLTLYVHFQGEGLALTVEYSRALFEPATMERLTGHYRTLLESLLATPTACVWDLAWVPEAERRQLVQTWNATARTFPALQPVHAMIAAQAARTPQAIAVDWAGETWRYADLDGQANALARYLQERGVTRETPVGIFMERSVRMLVALLGTLKAGGYYLPLDPGFPRERLALMGQEAGVAVLLTQTSLLAALPVQPAHVLDLEAAAPQLQHYSVAPVASPATLESLAYVLYTSGSTGRPKGVEIPHRALANFLCAMAEAPGIAPTDRLVAVTTLSFDIAALELYLPLTVGATVVLASRAVAADGAQLAAYLAERGGTMLQATPSTWHMLLEAGWQGPATFKHLSGGEALSRSLADRLLAGGGELWNLYGPTETTVWSTVQRVRPGPEPVAVGRPIANTTLYLLDARQHLVPLGVPGEVYIGGRGSPGAISASLRSRPSAFSTILSAATRRPGCIARGIGGAIVPMGRWSCWGGQISR